MSGQNGHFTGCWGCSSLTKVTAFLEFLAGPRFALLPDVSELECQFEALGILHNDER